MNESIDLPLALTRLWVGAFGLVVGSFLNVVIHRLPRGESIVHPRSRCPSCGHQIRWYENVPVLSWIALRGRCSGCKSPIAWRYPAVELLTGLVFVAAHESFGFTPDLGVALPFAAAILALVFIDAAHLVLPDAITLRFTLAGLLVSFVSPLTTPADALLGMLLSYFVLEGMNLAYKLVRGRDGFGGGDTKMMLMVAAFLGWQMALFTMVVGSFLGVLVGIPALVFISRMRPGSDAPPAEESGQPGSTCNAPDEASGAQPVLHDILPRSLDEALPLLLIPACAVAWTFEGGSPDRALGGLLAGIFVALAIHGLLRRSDRQSPASRLLPLAGALAGLPLRLVPLAIAAAALTLVAVIFRPRLLAPREAPVEEPELMPAPASPFHMQSELPFGVFLGAAALVALLWGAPLLDWYVDASARLFGLAEP